MPARNHCASSNRSRGDQSIDLTHTRTDVIDRCTHTTRREQARTVELDVAGDFAADEAVEIEIGGATCAKVQRIRRLQKQFVLEQ
jgi:hypothetical protein